MTKVNKNLQLHNLKAAILSNATLIDDRPSDASQEAPSAGYQKLFSFNEKLV